MKIYHYTTVETLALILKNKTIRFNRLDQVDDLEEGSTASAGMKLGKYTFVSCWTENATENIPLWAMYAKGPSGVRLTFDFEPFKDYEIESNEELQVEGGMTLKKLPASELMHSKYFILPNFNEKFFYRKIEYVDDLSERIKNTVQKNGNVINIKFGEIGTFKHTRWAFQEESRFVILAFPRTSNLPYSSPELGDEFINILNNNIEPPFSFYDLNLKDSAFDNLEITLSPQTDVSQKSVVEQLLLDYAPSATLRESSLIDSVRLK